MSVKTHISIVITGHVDSGKSTTTGHLLFALGGIPEREMEKLKQEAEILNKSSFAFAFYMDKQKEERERGVTIACTTKEFFTDNYHYTVIDAPGHRDFVKNMLTGASQADVALLMVPANKGGFETAIQKGNRSTGEVPGQTRQHALLLFQLGITQMIVGVNKMDDCKWDKDRYEEIKGEMGKMLKTIGYAIKRIPFIPFSGWTGDNLIAPAKDSAAAWFKGWECNLTKKDKVTGMTLKDAFDNYVKPPERPQGKRLYMPLSGCFKIGGVGDVLTGRVEQGCLKPGDLISFVPKRMTKEYDGKIKIFTIEQHHKVLPSAECGDNVGMNIKGLPKEANMLPKPGDVLYVNSEGALAGLVDFAASIFVYDHPGKLNCSKDGTKGGYCPLIFVRTSKSACQMSAIAWKKGKKSTGNVQVESPPYIEAADTAEVTFTPKEPFFLTSFEESEGLGRIAIMDSNTLVALGKVVSCNYKK
jgi:elongation factor 1-alpha